MALRNTAHAQNGSGEPFGFFRRSSAAFGRLRRRSTISARADVLCRRLPRPLPVVVLGDATEV